MPRPTTACLRLPEGLDVTWDRGVAHEDGSLFIYGWIEREYASALNGRAHEILVLQFDRTGQMVWWITSSAAWSQKLWDYFAEEGAHIDCLPWRVAIYQAGKIAEALDPAIITHKECGCPILGPHRAGCPAAPPPPPPAYLDPGVGIKEGGRPSGWGNQ